MNTKYPFGYKQGKVVYTVIDDAYQFALAKVYSTANAENSTEKIHHIAQKKMEKLNDFTEL